MTDVLTRKYILYYSGNESSVVNSLIHLLLQKKSCGAGLGNSGDERCYEAPSLALPWEMYRHLIGEPCTLWTLCCIILETLFGSDGRQID